MNENKYCTEYFSNMTEFKRKYSEFRDKRSRRKYVGKRKAEDKEGSEEIFAKRKHIWNEGELGKKFVSSTGDEAHIANQENNKDGCFHFGGYDFKEIGCNKIRCGVCQDECVRLVVHMNGSKNCAKQF